MWFLYGKWTLWTPFRKFASYREFHVSDVVSPLFGKSTLHSKVEDGPDGLPSGPSPSLVPRVDDFLFPDPPPYITGLSLSGRETPDVGDGG